MTVIQSSSLSLSSPSFTLQFNARGFIVAEELPIPVVGIRCATRQQLCNIRVVLVVVGIGVGVDSAG